MIQSFSYHGNSGVVRTGDGRTIHFAPNLSREPVAFDAELKHPLRFREAVSALHDVVVSDLRFVKKDKTAYLEWKKQESAREAAVRREAYRVAAEQVKARVSQPLPAGLEAEYDAARKYYWDARVKYSQYLQKHDPDLWRKLMPCDPVITVADDVVYFECFSKDESAYGNLSVAREDGFGASNSLKLGTTNVDYSQELYEQFQTLVAAGQENRAMTPLARKVVRRTASRRPPSRYGFEPLERRLVMAAAPAVEAVYVDATEWSPEFTAYLEERNEGTAESGFEVGNGGGPNSILPWISINEVSIQFTEDVNVDQGDLTITSASGATYTTTAFAYDAATDTATWTLNQQVNTADILTLRLDGDSATGVTDLEGNALRGNDKPTGGGKPAGSDFVLDVSILPGDANRDGVVNDADLNEIEQRFFSSIEEARGGIRRYTIYHDIDGSGFVLARDFVEARERTGTTLP